jgi:succinate dehydrogenase / fumarate reductase, cytochrome b subunit
MGILGTLIFLFLVLHLADFWVPSRFGGLTEIVYPSDPNQVYHNLYGKMIEVFQNPFIVVLYVLGCISLAYHLAHGFQSSFRTMGVFNKRYNAMLTSFGYGFSIIVAVVFAMMPITIYLGWIK